MLAALGATAVDREEMRASADKMKDSRGVKKHARGSIDKIPRIRNKQRVGTNIGSDPRRQRVKNTPWNSKFLAQLLRGGNLTSAGATKQ
jgi:hypothetical protein